MNLTEQEIKAIQVRAEEYVKELKSRVGCVDDYMMGAILERQKSKAIVKAAKIVESLREEISREQDISGYLAKEWIIAMNNLSESIKQWEES